MSFGWSADFVLLIGEAPASEQIAIARASTARWILIHRHGGAFRYVFSRSEFDDRLRAHLADVPTDEMDLRAALDLHEGQVSRQVPPPADGDAHDDSGAAAGESAEQVAAIDSTKRFVAVDATGQSIKVGGPDVIRTRTMRGVGRLDADHGTSGSVTRTATETATMPVADEGTTPVRYPSIEPLDAVRAGQRIVLEIDLLQQRSLRTMGEALSIGTLAPSWSTLDVTVTLVSAAIDFDDGAKGVVAIRRNDRSQPARVSGRVRMDAAVGSTIDVSAQFWFGTRFSGMAVRSLTVVSVDDESAASSASLSASSSAASSASSSAASSATAEAQHATSTSSNTDANTRSDTHGSVQVDTTAVSPDVTIYITVYDPSAPGRMHWRMVITPPFATLPPKLDGLIDLGADPKAEAAAMFKQFANLERGKHERTFLGFGESLWDRAPSEFRGVYWALHDHFQRPLTVQFVSDDPYLPWELMAPYRSVAGVLERHGPMALRHAVARWISRYAGLMRNTLPAGRMVTIAPKYKRANLKLSQAEATAQALQVSFQADAVEGTCAAMLELLEDPPAAPVGLLYFTGHGAVSADSAAASLIKLEDGTLSVNDVAQQGVQLGRRDGTLVFFNACEVGATAELLGTVGGWASAFLAREFRAFVAPLWAIDEEDAVTVTTELMTRIVREGQSVGAALRDVRAAHGTVSPTFYSYLLFGDVTAHFPSPQVPASTVVA